MAMSEELRQALRAKRLRVYERTMEQQQRRSEHQARKREMKRRKVTAKKLTFVALEMDKPQPVRVSPPQNFNGTAWAYAWAYYSSPYDDRTSQLESKLGYCGSLSPALKEHPALQMLMLMHDKPVRDSWSALEYYKQMCHMVNAAMTPHEPKKAKERKWP